ncbi:MAG: hypothetical protein WC775_06510 [Patescibacteria group bacterium]|jgi:hypothetical protein
MENFLIKLARIVILLIGFMLFMAIFALGYDVVEVAIYEKTRGYPWNYMGSSNYSDPHTYVINEMATIVIMIALLIGTGIAFRFLNKKNVEDKK